MLNLLFTSVLELSLSTGLVVAVFLALSPVLGKTVWPRWRCLLWTLLALRLLLPFSLPGQDAPVHLSLPTQAVSAPVVSTPSAPASDQTSSEAAAAASPTWLDLSALAWAAGGTGFLAWRGSPISGSGGVSFGGNTGKQTRSSKHCSKTWPSKWAWLAPCPWW
ncbi:MAG: hypothetical protein ACLS43_04780 [Evtepia gabavorous]